MEDDRGNGGSDLVGTAGPSLQCNGNPLIPPMVDMVTRAMKLPQPRSDPRKALPWKVLCFT